MCANNFDIDRLLPVDWLRRGRTLPEERCRLQEMSSYSLSWTEQSKMSRCSERFWTNWKTTVTCAVMKSQYEKVWPSDDETTYYFLSHLSLEGDLCYYCRLSCMLGWSSLPWVLHHSPTGQHMPALVSLFPFYPLLSSKSPDLTLPQILCLRRCPTNLRGRALIFSMSRCPHTVVCWSTSAPVTRCTALSILVHVPSSVLSIDLVSVQNSHLRKTDSTGAVKSWSFLWWIWHSG